MQYPLLLNEPGIAGLQQDAIVELRKDLLDLQLRRTQEAEVKGGKKR